MTLLHELRDRGLRVTADGDTVRVRGPSDVLTPSLEERLREEKPTLLQELRREAIEYLLDLVPVDPVTGLPDLPADKPATDRQAARLRELAGHPAFDPHRERVREIVDRALDGGLSQLGAYGLLGELGRRIAERRHHE